MAEKRKGTYHSYRDLIVLLGLLLISGLAYGRLVWMGGLFGDDPAVLVAYHWMGNAGFDAFYGWARPYSTCVYKLVVPLVGDNLHLYQAVTILMRVLSAWMLYVLLKKLFNTRGSAPILAAMICLIYPGFTQQAHSLHYLLHFTVLTIALLSLYLMLRAVRAGDKKRSIGWMLLSLLTACVHFSVEYFVGLELLRPLIIYLAVNGDSAIKTPFKQIWRIWLPFGGLLSAYIVWRVVLFHPAYPAITVFDLLTEAPFLAVVEVGKRALADLWKVSVSAWGNAFNLSIRKSGELLYVFIAIILSVGIGFLIGRLMKEGGENPSRKKSTVWIALGAAGLVCGGVPLWASQLPLEITFPWNRTTLCFLVGVSILTAGLLSILPKKAAAVLFAAITGFSIIFQFQVGLDYQRQWDKVRILFAQLVKQAPGLAPDTLILFEELPLRYYSANNLTAFLNWTYDPERRDGSERYKMFEISERLGNVLPALEPDIKIIHNTFHGNTSHVLVIAVDQQGCLVILDRNQPAPFVLPEMTAAARLLSNPGALITTANPPAELPGVLMPNEDLVLCK